MFDTIRRYLVWRGFAVAYVSNVTDIEDKIISRAKEAGTKGAGISDTACPTIRRTKGNPNLPS